ncbi:hypothetical protein BH10CYA1_BH10CYA1_30470 [soil metagenome]
MKNRDIVVIGASAGGIEATQHLLSLLPADLDASLFIVIHLAPDAPSYLSRIFSRVSRLSVSTAINDEAIQKSHVYVAPADWHMLLSEGVIKLGDGPLENRSRPSVDALFRTAAFSYSERVIGIVLSGALSDGTAGLTTIKSRGGVAIVQLPEEASFTGMPKSAIESADVDFVLPIAEIAQKIVELVSGVIGGSNEPKCIA